MLYKKGDLVFYKKYLGKILFAYEENKTYAVELYNYRGFKKMCKQIDQRELYKIEQLSMLK